MRITMIFIFSMAVLAAGAQKKAKQTETFYDHEWNVCDAGEASFYALKIQTDSGWHRQDYFAHGNIMQMNGTYDDSACTIKNGWFYFFYPNTKAKDYGVYKHGKKQGVWLSFYPTGVMSDSITYDNDNKVGISISWYADGVQKDSSNFQQNGGGVTIWWFDNGNPMAAGRYVNWKAQGKWQFFHSNGKMSALETYNDGNLTDKKYFDENGTSMDTTSNDRSATFPGGGKAWSKYLSGELFVPARYRITNSHNAVMSITFTIDEDGKIQDAYVSTTFHPDYDKIALDAIKKSPAWLPAVRHNRRMRDVRTQTITFGQGQEYEYFNG